MTTPTISVIISGVETPLSTFGALVSHVGWGMPDIDRYAERSPGQHGDTPAGFALSPRIGHLIFKMKLGDLAAMYTLRSQLLPKFSPSNSIILKFITTEGTRYFDCKYVGEMGLDWGVSDWAAQKFAVALKASDPTCYDPAGEAVTFSLDGGGDLMEVPTVIPMTVGASIINKIVAVTYAGSWSSFPLIRIVGPIANCIINNTSTGDILSFYGTTIAAGDHYDIDCRYGHKTVVDAAGVNRINKLTAASDLSTFHIGAPPELPGGINSIRVTGSAVSAATEINIAYFERFLGV